MYNDVKLLQEGRTVRVLLDKIRLWPAPDNGGRIETIEYTTQHIWPHKDGRFFYRRQPFFPIP